MKIAFGTDMGGIPWTESIANEFGYMVKFGMSPMDAIKSATSNAANLLEMKGEVGVIAPGAFADIVAVQGDPLANIEALEERDICDERWKSVQTIMKKKSVIVFIGNLIARGEEWQVKAPARRQ